MKEKLSVHIHHKGRNSEGGKADCLGMGELGPGEGIGGELAGGLFYVGLTEEGEVIATFEDTAFPENVQLGDIGVKGEGE